MFLKYKKIKGGEELKDIKDIVKGMVVACPKCGKKIGTIFFHNGDFKKRNLYCSGCDSNYKVTTENGIVLKKI